MRHLPDVERRSRIAQRHAIAPATRVRDPEAATRAMTVLHATEPATVYLSLLARVQDLALDDVDRALYTDRSVVKQLAMRRTLFVFPRDLLPAAWGSASARVAAQVGPRLAKEVEAAGIAADGGAWLEEARRGVLDRLADGSELAAQALREQVPALHGRLTLSVGKAYGGDFPIAPRVLTLLGAEGLITRGHNGGHWRTSRPQWTLMTAWLGEEPEPWPAEAGYAELARRWLGTFGPGTTADLRWWLGGTVGAVRKALDTLGAVEVGLDGPDPGWVLPGDEEPTADGGGEPWAALLPVLDATVMGWKDRGFFLGSHAAALFDPNGNAGTTAWWDGRVVGCWVQDPDGVVEVRLLEPVPEEGRRALDAEAARLTAWLDGTRIGTPYSTPAMRADWETAGFTG
jgi:hypothetical protein